jgi:hypothetical protein
MDDPIRETRGPVIRLGGGCDQPVLPSFARDLGADVFVHAGLGRRLSILSAELRSLYSSGLYPRQAARWQSIPIWSPFRRSRRTLACWVRAATSLSSIHPSAPFREHPHVESHGDPDEARSPTPGPIHTYIIEAARLPPPRRSESRTNGSSLTSEDFVPD